MILGKIVFRFLAWVHKCHFGHFSFSPKVEKGDFLKNGSRELISYSVLGYYEPLKPWNPKLEVAILRPFLVTIDLSFASTETKFINPKTKTQNNIVIYGFFLRKIILLFWLFLK